MKNKAMLGGLQNGWLWLAAALSVPVVMLAGRVIDRVPVRVSIPLLLGLFALAWVYAQRSQSKPVSQARAALIWALMFVPLFLCGLTIAERFGLGTAALVGLVGLALMLLHERFVRNRSWPSILWGQQP